MQHAWGKYLELDCEYNREKYTVKRLPRSKHRIYPDLIIHRRGESDSNILVMEFKGWWNTNTDGDEAKLKALTDQNNEYKYQYGISVVVTKELVECKPRWFIKGNEV